ncbi:MAG TPA: hypothetical protein VE152_03120 [Acidimicrobiales bacterium]|nr:hypothetical protein [Acidimicrobiales bacterium]
MATITVPRADVTVEEVTGSLRKALGPRYHVLPGMKAPWGSIPPREDRSDTIMVGTGSDLCWRTNVHLDRRGGQTLIRVEPPPGVGIGLFLFRLPNTFGIARKVRRVLAETPGLGSPGP